MDIDDIDNWLSEYVEENEEKEEEIREREEEIMEDFEKDNLETEFIKLFTSFSFTNILYGELVFHTILGQLWKRAYFYLGNKRIDLRTHFFYSADSGSGKSTALQFVSDTCYRLRVYDEKRKEEVPLIPIHIQRGVISDAGLIGSYEDEQVRIGNVVSTRHVLVPGILKKFENGGLIIFDEANFVLKAEEREYTKDFLGYLQTAMDYEPANLIVKVTKKGEIVLAPIVSFGFLTYPVHFRIYQVLQGGFFQRLLLYFRRLSLDEWNLIKEDVINSLGEEKKKESITSSISYTKLINGLIELTKQIENERPQILISPNAKNVLREYYDYYNKNYTFDGEKGQLFNTFRIRSLVQMTTLASHYAILGGRRKIVAEDMERARKIIEESIASLLRFIEEEEAGIGKKEAWEVYWEKLKPNLFIIARKLGVDSQGYVPLKTFVEFIGNYFGVSESRAYGLASIFERKKLIKKEGNMVKLI